MGGRRSERNRSIVMESTAISLEIRGFIVENLMKFIGPVSTWEPCTFKVDVSLSRSRGGDEMK